MEQDRYSEEGIEWESLELPDNEETVELFSLKPHGLLRVLDDESQFPKVNIKPSVFVWTLLSYWNSYIMQLICISVITSNVDASLGNYRQLFVLQSYYQEISNSYA